MSDTFPSNENPTTPSSEPTNNVDTARDVEIAIVTMNFRAAGDRNAELLAVLSKYVVLTRMADGCRNVDLCSSFTREGHHLIVQKWESGDHQRRHFDSAVMVDMATACAGLLASAPEIDLWDPTSAHDLR